MAVKVYGGKLTDTVCEALNAQSVLEEVGVTYRVEACYRSVEIALNSTNAEDEI